MQRPQRPTGAFVPPAVHVPHIVSPASWSAVGTQLKTLLFGNPLATAAVAIAGAAALAVAYTSTVQIRRKRLERRRATRQVKTDFVTYRLDVLKYISEQEWNHFTIPQLTQLYDIFSKLLDQPRRGVLPISALTQIIRRSGVSDEQVAHACARFFDLDGNCQLLHSFQFETRVDEYMPSDISF